MSTGAPVARVAIHDLGGDGPTLLISHATGFHGRCYQPMADALVDHFHSIAFDYRGHGDTPAPEGWVVDWEGYGDDAMTVAAALDRPLVAFGHSMGGTALLMAARRHPDWFHHLVLFEPIVFPPLPPGDLRPVSPIAEGARRRRPTFPSYEDAYANYASKPPMSAFTPEALDAYVDHGFERDGEGVRLKCSPEHEAATFEAGPKHRMWDALPAIEVPVTVVGGRLDGDPPAEIAGEIASRLANGTYVRHDDFDHFAPMADPVATAKAVLDAVG